MLPWLLVMAKETRNLLYCEYLAIYDIHKSFSCSYLTIKCSKQSSVSNSALSFSSGTFQHTTHPIISDHNHRKELDGWVCGKFPKSWKELGLSWLDRELYGLLFFFKVVGAFRSCYWSVLCVSYMAVDEIYKILVVIVFSCNVRAEALPVLRIYGTMFIYFQEIEDRGPCWSMWSIFFIVEHI